VRGFARAARDRHPRNGSDRGERLAAKAHGGHRFQVLEAANLAGGVARERQRQLVARDTGTVILDLDPAGAAGLEHHGDRARAGVDAVFQQFLEHRRGPLDDLAGRYLAHEEMRQNANGGHASSI
jgi:hypothetical protein